MTTALQRADTIPAHVPSELVRTFDYARVDEEFDFHEFWSEARSGPPIFYTPCQGGHWVFTRHEDVAHAVSTPSDFSSIYEIIPFGSSKPHVPPFGMDPPQHTEFRKLLAPFFSPKSIEDLAHRTRQLTLKLLDAARGQTGCEFIADFALTMPIGIFMGLLDLPESDRTLLVDIASRAVRSTDGRDRLCAFQQLEDYLVEKYEERRRKPDNDVLSALLAGRVEGGRPLTQEELLLCGSNLIAAGMDTVAGVLSFVMKYLAENPAAQRRLAANPEDIPLAIEELMRYASVSNLGRTVTHDLVYKGIHLKKGDAVLCSLSMAGIDDEKYESPLTVDFDRPDKRSLIFGKGPHQCIGAFLARTELRIFVHEWLKRVPEFRVMPGETIRTGTGPACAVTYLPLVWDTPLP